MSDAMTTTEETQITGGNNMSLSLSNILFYFRIAVLVIGVIGTAANGVITYAMIASKQHKKHLLIFNQNALDLFSCIFLAVTYPTKLILNIPLTGSLGYWLCTLCYSSPNLALISESGSVQEPLKMSRIAQNCGFWPPEADAMNTFR